MLKTALPYLLAGVTFMNSSPGAKTPSAPPVNGTFEGDAIVVTGVTRSNEMRIAVLLDTDADGKANYSFTGQSTQPANVLLAGKVMAGVRMVRDARSVSVYQNDLLVFWMGLDATPADPAGPTLVGIGGKDVERFGFRMADAAQSEKVRELITKVCGSEGDGDEDACSSGGVGSTNCSITCTVGISRECSTSCGSGYYACCNCFVEGSGYGATCSCVPTS